MMKENHKGEKRMEFDLTGFEISIANIVKTLTAIPESDIVTGLIGLMLTGLLFRYGWKYINE